MTDSLERDGKVWRVHTSRHVPAGIQERTVEWDHEPTAEQVIRACDWDRNNLQLGETVVAKVIGPFLYVKDVGPPMWRWPKVKVNRWTVGVGWRMTAYYLSSR